MAKTELTNSGRPEVLPSEENDPKPRLASPTCTANLTGPVFACADASDSEGRVFYQGVFRDLQDMFTCAVLHTQNLRILPEPNFALFCKNVEISGCNRLQHFAEFQFKSNTFYQDFQNFCWSYCCGTLVVNQFELPM